MIPLIAATSAISSVDKVGTAAISQLKKMAGAGQTGNKQTTDATSDSFGALLAAQGVNVSNNSGPVGVGAAGVLPVG
jgi:hypothetical protein